MTETIVMVTSGADLIRIVSAGREVGIALPNAARLTVRRDECGDMTAEVMRGGRALGRSRLDAVGTWGELSERERGWRSRMYARRGLQDPAADAIVIGDIVLGSPAAVAAGGPVVEAARILRSASERRKAAWAAAMPEGLAEWRRDRDEWGRQRAAMAAAQDSEDGLARAGRAIPSPAGLTGSAAAYQVIEDGMAGGNHAKAHAYRKAWESVADGKAGLEEAAAAAEKEWLDHCLRAADVD